MQTPDETLQPPRPALQPLALRMAHRNRLRAERLARRLRDPAWPAALARSGAAPPAPSEPAPSSPALFGSGPARQVGGLAEPPACFADRVAALRRSAPTHRPRGDVDPEAAAALEEFLRMLIDRAGSADPETDRAPGHIQSNHASGSEAARNPAAPAAPGRVLSFQGSAARRSPDPACDLDRLPGTGPGLIWALRHAGVDDLAVLAAFEPEDLAARLGPLGRLVPARAWIATARDGRPSGA